MKIYFAPLEGITGHIFRNAYEKHFGGIDAYYTPFVTTRDGGLMKKREKRELLPENNPGITLVPQIMTSRAEDFCRAAEQIAALGYGEVNLNLGCPSGTVVPKGKGAGFLRRTEELDRFLEAIFQNCKIEISVKSRIGFYEPEEFSHLLEIYNRYPIKEMILHLRTREEFYQGRVHSEVFSYAMSHGRHPLCYNGDVGTREEILELEREYAGISSVMIGRGFLRHPGFTTGLEKDGFLRAVHAFLKDLEQGYVELLSGEVPVLFKMKEIWSYLKESIPDGDRWFRKIKKTKRLSEYDRIVTNICFD